MESTGLQENTAIGGSLLLRSIPQKTEQHRGQRKCQQTGQTDGDSRAVPRHSVPETLPNQPLPVRNEFHDESILVSSTRRDATPAQLALSSLHQGARRTLRPLKGLQQLDQQRVALRCTSPTAACQKSSRPARRGRSRPMPVDTPTSPRPVLLPTSSGPALSARAPTRPRSWASSISMARHGVSA